jgi:O-antigen ligase
MTTLRHKYPKYAQNSAAAEALRDGMSLIFVGLMIFVGMIPQETAFLAIGGGAISATRFLGFIIFGLWTLKHTLKSRPIIWFPYAKWFLPFLLWAAISVLWSINANDALRNSLTLLQMFLISLVIYDEVENEKQLGWMLGVFLSSCLLAAILGYLRVDLTSVRYLLTLESQGAKEYATIVGMAFLSGVILVSLVKKQIHKLFFFIMAIICIYPLFATGERGVYLGILAGWMIVTLLSRGKFTQIAYGILITLLVYWVFQFAVQNGYLSNYVVSRLTISEIIQTGGTGRVNIWKVGLNMFLDHPMLGVGIGNFPDAYYYYAPNYYWASKEMNGSHSDLINIGTELGLIGLILFLGMLIYIGMRFLPLFKKPKPRPGIYSMMILLLGLWSYIFTVGMTSVTINRKFYWITLVLVEVVIKLFNKTPELGSNLVAQPINLSQNNNKNEFLL